MTKTERDLVRKLRKLVRELSRKLRAINCGDCHGTELKHKARCPFRYL